MSTARQQFVEVALMKLIVALLEPEAIIDADL